MLFTILQDGNTGIVLVESQADNVDEVDIQDDHNYELCMMSASQIVYPSMHHAVHLDCSLDPTIEVEED